MTSEIIRDVALKLFCEQGYENATMRQIANEMGIKAASIYNHYGSKKKIFISIMEYILEKDLNNIIKQFEEVNKDDITCEQVLFHIFRSRILYYRENQYEFKFWNNFSMFPPEEVKDEINKFQYSRRCELYKLYRLSSAKCINEASLSNMTLEVIQKHFSIILQGYLMLVVNYGLELNDDEIYEAWKIIWNGHRNKQ